MLALNVTVVLDDNATSYLNFDVIGKILADETSGSSGGGITCDTGGEGICYEEDLPLEWTDCDDGVHAEIITCKASGDPTDECWEEDPCE